MINAIFPSSYPFGDVYIYGTGIKNLTKEAIGDDELVVVFYPILADGKSTGYPIWIRDGVSEAVMDKSCLPTRLKIRFNMGGWADYWDWKAVSMEKLFLIRVIIHKKDIDKDVTFEEFYDSINFYRDMPNKEGISTTYNKFFNP